MDFADDDDRAYDAYVDSMNGMQDWLFENIDPETQAEIDADDLSDENEGIAWEIEWEKRYIG